LNAKLTLAQGELVKFEAIYCTLTSYLLRHETSPIVSACISLATIVPSTHFPSPQIFVTIRYRFDSKYVINVVNHFASDENVQFQEALRRHVSPLL
jgi:hypothetical protein